jgi:hypothetical protein
VDGNSRDWTVAADEEPLAKDIVAETKTILRSESFRRHLEAFRNPLWISPAGGSASGADVARVYLGVVPARPSRIAWVGDATDLRAGTVLYPPSAGSATSGSATITLGRGHLARWSNPRPKDADHKMTPELARRGRACVINTLSHEFAHTIVGSEGQVFTDAGYHFFFWRELVSYTVGGLAECTYLESNGGLFATFEACADEASRHPARCPVLP